MTGYLAGQEEKEEEEVVKNFTKQQSIFSSIDKPESSTTAESSKMKKEGSFVDERIRESVKTDAKSVVSFAPNLVSSTPRKDEESRGDDPNTSQIRWQGETSFFPGQTNQYAHRSPMVKTNERQNQIQYEQEADETKYGSGHEMRYNPATSWGSGWDPHACSTE